MVMLGVLGGCTTASEAESSTVEIFSWWVAPGEVEALEALIEHHTAQHVSTTVVNAAATDSATARERLADRLAHGLPPDLFQGNVGVSIADYVGTVGATDSMLEPIGDEMVLSSTAFPAPLLDLASVDGQRYGVPLNVHRINVLFYNTAVLDAAGVVPPTTIDALLSACVAIEASGVDCIAAPARDGWTNMLYLVENVLVATAGADYYERFMRGEASPEDPEVREAAMTYLELFGHASGDSRTLAWDAAVARIADGTAAFTVMGDWAKGFLTTLGLEPGVDFGSVPFPGSDGTFVFTSDAFVLPRGAANREGALDFLETCATPEGQIAFNRIKGSIPARTDVDVSSFDPLGRQTAMQFASGRLVPAASGLARSTFTDPVGEAIADMLDTNDPDVVVNTMAAFYDVLQD
jgi:glucose/mannose transport system substrate-binding protein